MSKSPNPNLYQRVNIFTTLCMILVFGKLFILILNLLFPRLIVYLDTIEIYKGFRHSQRSVTFIEKIKMNCINLIFLDPAYNTSFFFSLYFVQYMPSLKYLDITSCQNILESLFNSLYKEKKQ